MISKRASQRPIRTGLNAVNLIFNAEALRPPITGIGNYSFHLLQQMLKQSLVDDVHSFTGTGWVSGNDQLAITSALKAQDAPSTGGAKDAIIHGIRTAIGAIPGTKTLYDSVMDGRFETLANSVPNAIYHETNYIFKSYNGPSITTVHDLSHVRFPQFHPEHVVKRLDALLPKSLDRADMVIAVSDLVREEVIEYYGIAPDKIRTVYEGVEDLYRPRAEAETTSVLADYGLTHKNYVLLVATLEPRKGIGVLLDAWERLPEELRRFFPLVLTGSAGWRNDSLRDQLESLIAGGTVRHLGYVPSEVLPILYSGAAVFSYPSVYEGFGLPVLDAMSSAVPVICRAETSMSEFAEGACLLCNTGEPEELAERLEELLRDNAKRQYWAEQGRVQAAKFSWERCARETSELYKLVAGS
ncbi:MAG: glycosyltransferase involved in cell wall biosynthesis [Halioglobus sp.]|jgi:glycosyltransferase involved in cell wall biosynthesis